MDGRYISPIFIVAENGGHNYRPPLALQAVFVIIPEEAERHYVANFYKTKWSPFF